MRRSLSGLMLLLLGGCPTSEGPSPECASAADCGGTSEVCAGCPPLSEALCLEGACEARGDDAVDVIADVNIDRDLVAQVASIVHVVASATAADGPLACATAFDSDGIAASVNVLAAGYKAVSGGSFHDGVGFGRVPEGDVAVLVLATGGAAGEGEIIAKGCAVGLVASAPSLEAGVVTVE